MPSLYPAEKPTTLLDPLPPIDEAGHFEAELVAVYAPPSFLTEVGRVEIVSTRPKMRGGRRPPSVGRPRRLPRSSKGA